MGYVKKEHRVCTRCVMDTTAPDIKFDAQGVCNYCHMQDKLERLFPLEDKGWDYLERMAEKIKRAGRGKKHDCVVGVSGGRDTSYCLYIALKLGLRPLAVHFDNGWDSDIAKTNLMRMCNKLGIELHTIIMDWEESRDLTNVTIKAGIPYIDMTDDIGIASALWRTAAEENIGYIILSHSFREEGITPLKWNYFDGRFTRTLIDKFGTMRYRMFKNIDIPHVLYWTLFKRIRIFNITNYYDDTGTNVEELLKREYDWVDTGQHHYDNEMFALVFHYAREKFGIDWRVVELSARVRTGILTRQQALDILASPPFFENQEVVNYCLKKQGITREQYEAYIAAPNYYFSDYATWYSVLKFFKLPIKLLCRAHFLPAHAYEKYFEA